jgi:hypothetical protein
LVGAQQLSTDAADADPHSFGRPLKSDAIGGEGSMVWSSALPLGGQLRKEIIDPSQQPEVSNRGALIAKACRDCRLSGARCTVENHHS